MTGLHERVDASARRRPDQVAVEDPQRGTLTYGELVALTDRVRDRLRVAGVGPGDRVAVWMPKSIDALAVIVGTLKAGAAYVPLDPGAPASRNAYIVGDCEVKAVVLDARFESALRQELADRDPLPSLLPLEGAEAGRSLRAALDRADAASPAPATASARVGPDDLAYILYTSGSTGRPKGVVLSHRAATSFVDWCAETFRPTDADRFSSHAPFHFDLSVLDLYLPLTHGATVVLVREDVGKEPARLAPLIAQRRLTVWYSAPSILSLLAQFGRLDGLDLSTLRLVLFAGEVFPVKHLRVLQRLVPSPRYWNLYGPTETNVCTAYEIPGQVPGDRTEPYPIGRPCSHLRAKVVDEQGRRVPTGHEGELVVSGPAVMRGYWNLPEQTGRAFLEDGEGRWYRTGDVVVEAPDGNYTFLGRRDRMVKRRGYRIELGEIEAGLYRHPSIKEAAVVAVPDGDGGVLIRAFLSCAGDRRPSMIELKRFCTEHLPLYMVPDAFSFRDALPKTSTDKIDYQQLKGMT